MWRTSACGCRSTPTPGTKREVRADSTKAPDSRRYASPAIATSARPTRIRAAFTPAMRVSRTNILGEGAICRVMPQRSSGKPSRRRAAASIDAARASAERRARSVSRRSRARCAGRRRVRPGTRAGRAVIAGAETPRGNGGGRPSGGPDRSCSASTAPSRTARAMLPEERASARSQRPHGAGAPRHFRSLDPCRMRNAVRHRSDHYAPPAPRNHGLRQPAHATPPSAGASRSRRPPADCARSARRPSASWRWMPIVRSPRPPNR